MNFNRPTLAVHPWPGALPVPVEGVIVIGLVTADRSSARVQIRLAVQQMLGQLLARSPERIVLTSMPGQAPVIAVGGIDSRMGLSISHEADLSLAAINLDGRIGVDLMRVPQANNHDHDHEWIDLMTMARDYLGPACAIALAGVAPDLRRSAFASAWSAHEASLKCHGLALAEWGTMPPPAVLRIAALDLPAPFVGAVATPDARCCA
jgi:4'-phosphopantetheinyl transferase